MIENFNLIEMIEAMEPRQSEDNVNLIINFSRQINSAMKDVEGIGYLKTAFENRMDEFRDYGLQQFVLFYSMLTMAIFREVTGCQWLIPFDGRKMHNTASRTSCAGPRYARPLLAALMSATRSKQTQ